MERFVTRCTLYIWYILVMRSRIIYRRFYLVGNHKLFYDVERTLNTNLAIYYMHKTRFLDMDKVHFVIILFSYMRGELAGKII